jgi:peptide/nickel transport system substrate-binding protein
MHTTNGESIATFREQAEDFPMEEYTQWGATGYLLMQVGDPASALSDQRVRCALAQATDMETINEAAGGGVNPIANGPYSPERVGHLEDTGYPTYDPEAAREAVEAWEAENGPLEIAYATTNDSNNLLIAQLVQQMWSEVGIDSSIEQIEQGQFIVTALQGDFEVFLWRNHNGPDPDGDYIWWHSSNALPEGQLGLNFGRINDPVIDENLDVIHTNPDPDARQEAAENINRRFAEQCYNLWYVWPAWGVPHTPDVEGLGAFTAPDGELVAAGEAPYPQSLWLAP